MQRIRKGDEVIVIAGKDKGKKGVVLSRVDDRHVTVEGVNVAKKHVRPNPMTGAEGGVVDKVSRRHCSGTHQEVRLQDDYAGSPHHQDHPQHGCR